jgi:hypothetical protein
MTPSIYSISSQILLLGTTTFIDLGGQDVDDSLVPAIYIQGTEIEYPGIAVEVIVMRILSRVTLRFIVAGNSKIGIAEVVLTNSLGEVSNRVGIKVLAGRVAPDMDMIIEETIDSLLNHPLIINPPFKGTLNSNVLITNARDFAGIAPEGEIVLSVYPYHEGNQETIASVKNKSDSINYEDYALGGGANTEPGARYTDTTHCNILIKMHVRGASLGPITKQSVPTEAITSPYQKPISKNSPTRIVQRQENTPERVLRKYMELIRLILVSDLRLLNGLLRNSTVNHINFLTSRWDKLSGPIFHEATLLWSTKYYSPRNWKDAFFVPVSNATPGLLDKLVDNGAWLALLPQLPLGTTIEIFTPDGAEAPLQWLYNAITLSTQPVLVENLDPDILVTDLDEAFIVGTSTLPAAIISSNLSDESRVNGIEAVVVVTTPDNDYITIAYDLKGNVLDSQSNSQRVSYNGREYGTV